MSADLLRLLEQAHPGRPQADLLAMIDATPNAPTKATGKPVGRRVGSRPRTAASMERRRSWAASGRMPPRLAARFTLAEAAVLSVVAVQVVQKGACTLTLDHIAALAGVCRTSVRNALRAAHGLGLIRIEERRLTAWRNAPNRVTIIAPEWTSWLELRRRGGGRKSLHATDTNYSNPSELHSVTTAQNGFRQAEGRSRWRGTRF